VWGFHSAPLILTVFLPPFLLYVSKYCHWLVGFGAHHYTVSLAARSPLRDLLKYNIWFHFEVPKHLNHLARKDAGRVVKLLCLAAGSLSPEREHKGEERYHQAPGNSPPCTDERECCHCWLLYFYSHWNPNGMLLKGISGCQNGWSFPCQLDIWIQKPKSD